MFKKFLAASLLAAALSTQAIAASGPISLYLYSSGVDRTNQTVLWFAGTPLPLSYIAYNADSCDVAFYRTPYGTSNTTLVNYQAGLPPSHGINDSYAAGYVYQYVIKCFNSTNYQQAYVNIYPS